MDTPSNSPSIAVELGLIGGFSLRVGGQARELPVRKSQLVLARLALAPARMVPRYDLRHMFWEMSSDSQAQVSLRQSLARIRKGLGAAADCVQSDLDMVRLGPGLCTDTGRLDDPVLPGAAFDDALVSGELLAGQTPREPAAENWLAVERSSIRQKQTRYCLAMALEALGDARHEAALQAGLKGLLIDNLDERLHVAVMRAYAGLGNRSAALEQYQQCEAILMDELGVAPEPATRTLSEQLRSRQASATPSRAPARSAGAQAEPEGEETEIRQVSVICVGAAASDDPEDYAGLPPETAQAIRSMAAEHGALALPGEDGEAFLVFGAASASESDPVRAATLAQLLVRGAPGLRAGVASGRVVVARQPGGSLRISGEPRGRALSLMGQAARGQAIVSERGLACRPAPVFVGREVELGYLSALFDRCQDGIAAVAVVQGEPGIGKTRLAGEFAARIAARGMEVLRIGFEPFAQSAGAARKLACAAVEAGGDLPESAGPAAHALFADMTGLDIPAGGASLISAMSEDRRRQLSIEVMRDLLLAIPVHAAAILVEDTHWARRRDIDFLVSLSNVLPGLRAMIVATERISGALFAPALAQAAGQTTASTLTLAPFTSRDAQMLASGMGIEDEELVRDAVLRSKGNPLFLACLLETGRSPGGGLPSTIVALVQEQTDLLPAAPRTQLRRAAVLGKRFNPAHYAAIFGPAGWDSLCAAGCLYQEQDRLVFPHALVHEAVYSGLTRADRRQYHAQAAAFFAEIDPVLWADHALAADLPEAARACSDAADLLLPRYEFERGLGYIDAGLERATGIEDRALLHIARGSINRERGMLDEALADYEAASGAEVPPRVRIQALIRRVWVHRLRGEADLSDAVLAEAGATDLGALPPDQVSEYENQLGAQAFVRGDFEACARHNRRARELATTPLHQSRALGGLGDALYAEGRMHAACATFRECNALARTHGLGVVELSHLLMEADALHFARPGPEARGMLPLILDRARDAGNARVEIMCLITLAEICVEDARFAEAAGHVAAAQAVMDAISADRFDSWQIRYRTQIAAETAPAEARRLISDWLARAAAACPDRLRGDHYALLAQVAETPEEAQEALAEGARVAASGEARFTQFWYHRIAIDAALRIGREDLALASAQALEEMTAAEPLGWTGLVIRRARLLAGAMTQGVTPQAATEAAALRQEIAAALQGALLPGLAAVFGPGDAPLSPAP
ncbi:BTAD domain-containing putative transcriptional regulator [Poseidonocella sp. HB161398]|uniref:ATP-binding protein n=1 Tax=Poseidonocella sp. HB161398 TaxID=2320855 RepID=UPI00148670C5|nr:BTAD domain-containing putative transcriptional regulator [Poseidonocella sp. HB161398]